MKKFEKLVKEIKDGVEYEMRESIAAGWNHLSYEHDFGNTTVMVEVELVGCGLVVQINDVWVERDNSEHQSPMVVEAIKQALPCWVDVQREVEAENEMYELQEQYMMNFPPTPHYSAHGPHWELFPGGCQAKELGGRVPD